MNAYTRHFFMPGPIYAYSLCGMRNMEMQYYKADDWRIPTCPGCSWRVIEDGGKFYEADFPSLVAVHSMLSPEHEL